MLRLLACVLALSATATFAGTTPVSTFPAEYVGNTCYAHKDFQTNVLAAGFALLGSKSYNADGRKVETYYKDATGEWVQTVVFRTGGIPGIAPSIRTTDCTVVVGVGDPGVKLPTAKP
jgi:hypothetical protein